MYCNNNNKVKKKNMNSFPLERLFIKAINNHSMNHMNKAVTYLSEQ